MALPSSITVNVGTPAADVVFSDKHLGPSGREAIYFGPSPDGDIAGRVKQRFSHDSSGNGTVRSLHQVVLPRKDASGKYVQPITVNLTVVRQSNVPIAEIVRAIEISQESGIIADVRAAIAGAIL